MVQCFMQASTVPLLEEYIYPIDGRQIIKAGIPLFLPLFVNINNEYRKEPLPVVLFAVIHQSFHSSFLKSCLHEVL